MKRIHEQFVVFIVGGFLSAAIDLGVTILLLSAGVASLAAVSGGFVSGLVVNLLYHSRITFQSSINIRTVIRYCLIVALNYLLMVAIVYVVHDILGHSVVLGKIVSLPAVAVNGFIWSRYWIFTGTGLVRQSFWM